MRNVDSLLWCAAAIILAGCTEPPQSAFWSHLGQLCDTSYRGELVEGSAAGDSVFANNELIMHVRECSETEMRIPFHVGEDRSRTWVVSLSDTGLRLMHDHRHEDGSEGEITMYGGDTNAPGTEFRQDFHADEHTAQLVPDAATNVWSIEIEPGTSLTYGLNRVGTERRVRIRFDLTQPVPAPPPPWGSS